MMACSLRLSALRTEFFSIYIAKYCETILITCSSEGWKPIVLFVFLLTLASI